MKYITPILLNADRLGSVIHYPGASRVLIEWLDRSQDRFDTGKTPIAILPFKNYGLPPNDKKILP